MVSSALFRKKGVLPGTLHRLTGHDGGRRKSMRCDLCGRDFDPPEGTIPVALMGRYFCTLEHEKKYLELYNKWIETAYIKENYAERSLPQ